MYVARKHPWIHLAVAASTLTLACGGGAPKPAANAKVSSEAVVVASGSAGPVWSDDDAKPPVSSADPSWGDRDALVTLVVFSDLQCPYCSRLEQSFAELRKDYTPAQIRIVWKNEPLPFHVNARPAAEAARGVFELAGNSAFWSFQSLAFENQQELNEANYLAWARAAGVKDISAFGAGLASHRWAAKIDADHQLAEKHGVRGTPMTFVNGVGISGAQPIENFAREIDKQLTAANEAVAAGTARDKLYATLSPKNFAAPPSDDDEEREDGKAVHNVPVGNSPVNGDSAKALVTIVEFSDYQCPFCGKAEPTLTQLRQSYGDRLRIVWKDQPLPFHPNALPAARLAREARAQKGDAAFWAAHHKLFGQQQKLGNDDLLAVAAELKLNAAKVKLALAGKNKAHEAGILADQKLGYGLDARGTPAFFINGRRLSGAQPFEAFKAVIDEELVKANAKLQAGVAQSQLYDALVKDGIKAKAVADSDIGKPRAPGGGTELQLAEGGAPAEPVGAPSIGAANAPVIVQLFSDYQCPFCARVEPTLTAIRKKYGAKVRVVWRDFPLRFHPNAMPAAEAAREVLRQKGQAAYWNFHEQLFADQQNLSAEALAGLASAAGCNMQEFNASMNDHRHRGMVEWDLKQGEAAGIRGTPHAFVNDYIVTGTQPIEVFEKAVNAALKKPRKAKAKIKPEPEPFGAKMPPQTGSNSPATAGLKIEDLAVGTGAYAMPGWNVRVHYVGTLQNGKEFDASREHSPEGFSFDLGAGRMIKGWELGVQGMRVGGKRRLTIAPELGYGARGQGESIPPNATLIFEIELLDVSEGEYGAREGFK